MRMMGSSLVLAMTIAWGYTATAQGAGLVGGAVAGAVGGAYLDSFTIQDSCQFNLCGPEYSPEFLLGECGVMHCLTHLPHRSGK